MKSEAVRKSLYFPEDYPTTLFTFNLSSGFVPSQRLPSPSALTAAGHGPQLADNGRSRPPHRLRLTRLKRRLQFFLRGGEIVDPRV